MYTSPRNWRLRERDSATRGPRYTASITRESQIVRRRYWIESLSHDSQKCFGKTKNCETCRVVSRVSGIHPRGFPYPPLKACPVSIRFGNSSKSRLECAKYVVHDKRPVGGAGSPAAPRRLRRFGSLQVSKAVLLKKEGWRSWAFGSERGCTSWMWNRL